MVILSRKGDNDNSSVENILAWKESNKKWHKFTDEKIVKFLKEQSLTRPGEYKYAEPILSLSCLYLNSRLSYLCVSYHKYASEKDTGREIFNEAKILIPYTISDIDINFFLEVLKKVSETELKDFDENLLNKSLQIPSNPNENLKNLVSFSSAPIVNYFYTDANFVGSSMIWEVIEKIQNENYVFNRIFFVPSNLEDQFLNWQKYAFPNVKVHSKLDDLLNYYIRYIFFYVRGKRISWEEIKKLKVSKLDEEIFVNIDTNNIHSNADGIIIFKDENLGQKIEFNYGHFRRQTIVLKKQSEPYEIRFSSALPAFEMALKRKNILLFSGLLAVVLLIFNAENIIALISQGKTIVIEPPGGDTAIIKDPPPIIDTIQPLPSVLTSYNESTNWDELYSKFVHDPVLNKHKNNTIYRVSSAVKTCNEILRSENFEEDNLKKLNDRRKSAYSILSTLESDTTNNIILKKNETLLQDYMILKFIIDDLVDSANGELKLNYTNLNDYKTQLKNYTGLNYREEKKDYIRKYLNYKL